MHPVGLATTTFPIAAACTAILLWLMSLAGLTPPDTVTAAIGTLNAVVVSYVIFRLTKLDPALADVVGIPAPPPPVTAAYVRALADQANLVLQPAAPPAIPTSPHTTPGAI